MPSLTPKERILTTLAHREPDRLPRHNLQPGVPPENIVALYEAARESGGYP